VAGLSVSSPASMASLLVAASPPQTSCDHHYHLIGFQPCTSPRDSRHCAASKPMRIDCQTKGRSQKKADRTEDRQNSSRREAKSWLDRPTHRFSRTRVPPSSEPSSPAAGWYSIVTSSLCFLPRSALTMAVSHSTLRATHLFFRVSPMFVPSLSW
jgi:hypothetical protein